MLIQLLGERLAGIALDIAFIGTALSSIWAAIKVSYEAKANRPFPKNKLTLAIDIVVDLLPNLPGAIHTIAKSQGSRLFLADQAPRANINVQAAVNGEFDPEKVIRAVSAGLNSQAKPLNKDP